MANEYLVNASDMTAVAEAIRSKTGSADPLVFPDGFVNAISGGTIPRPIRMTVNHTTLDTVAWGGKTYREIFISGNIITTGNVITNSTSSRWNQFQSYAKPKTSTKHYNTGPCSWDCSGTASTQMYQDFSLPIGENFYIACKRKLVSYTAGKWLGVEVYYIDGAGKVISDTIDANSVTNTFETVSHTFNPKTATTQIWIGSGGSANLTGYVDDVVCVNMTELFGDNVPTKAKMNELYDIFLSLYNCGEFRAHGTFTDENGQFDTNSIIIESGKVYYVPFGGTSAATVFEYGQRTGSVGMVASSQGEEMNGHSLCSDGKTTAYYMYPDVAGSDARDITVNLDLAMHYAISRLIAITEAEVGYIEKASSSNLDDKTANPGDKNYTKYARDLDAIANFYNTQKQSVAWCCVFVHWCFVQAFGVDAAKALCLLPSKSLGAGVGYCIDYYESAGQFHTSCPMAGDQIFFGDADSEDHSGIVYRVDNEKVYTIEGNTADPTGASAYYGVYKKEYLLTDTRILGYGRPDYTVA